jgi:hypothetical protein
MGTEAGQSVSVILARKEAERQLCQGVFYWGIGNALGLRIWDFVNQVLSPTVLFTHMKSKPKGIDVNPHRVVRWTAFHDRRGFKVPFPRYAFVTSRVDAGTRHTQSRFALVCRANSPLGGGKPYEPLLSGRLANYRGNTRVAPSQVTALVEIAFETAESSRQYEVVFSAELVEPYYVRLADPVDIPGSVLAELNRIPLSRDFSTEQWRLYLDQRFGFGGPLPVQQEFLSATSEMTQSDTHRERSGGQFHLFK